MSHIGRLEGYGIGKESTRGTAVDPSVWIDHNEADIENDQENVQDESALGVLMTSQGSEKTKQYAEGVIGEILSTRAIGYIFLSLLGQVTTTDVSGAKQHSFSMLESNSKPSLTLSKKTPIGGERFANAMISSLSISANVGEAVMMKAGVRAKAGVAATLTKAYTSDSKFYSKHIEVSFDDVGGDFSGASAQCFESIELNATQELEDSHCFASGVDVGDIHNKGFSIDGNFSKLKNDNTFKDYRENGTYKAMRIKIVNTGVSIGSTNPSIQIDIAKVSFEGYESDGGLNDIMRENVSIKGHYDVANSKDIDIILVNDKASY